MNRGLKIREFCVFAMLNYGQALIAFLLSLYLVKELPVEVYGFYTYGLVLAGIVTITGQFGMDKTLVRDLVQLENSDQTLVASVLLKLIVSCVIGLGIFLWVYAEGEFTGVCGLAFFLLYGLGQSLSPKAWYDANFKFRKHALLILLEKVVFLTGCALVFYLGDQEELTPIVFLLLASRWVILYFEWHNIDCKKKFALKPTLEICKLLVVENKWVWIATIGNLGMTHLNQVILKAGVDVTQLAYFGVAFQIIAITRILQFQVIRFLAKGVAEITQNYSQPSEIYSFLFKKGCLSLGATLSLAVPVYILAPYFFEMIGRGYENSTPILNVLLLWSLVLSVSLLVNQCLVGLRLQKSYLVAAVTAGFVAVILCCWMVPIYQGVGAALSLCIGQAVSLLLQFFFVQKYIKSNQNNAH